MSFCKHLVRFYVSLAHFFESSVSICQSLGRFYLFPTGFYEFPIGFYEFLTGFYEFPTGFFVFLTGFFVFPIGFCEFLRGGSICIIAFLAVDMFLFPSSSVVFYRALSYLYHSLLYAFIVVNYFLK